ncbi:MAG: hypothetical protein J6W42_01465 [Bacteroidaceae bacterium]|nr:hypothetical protein [Bacteroidaceae bacterium]
MRIKRIRILSMAVIMAVSFTAMLTSCSGGRYHELPFGGMNGHVQKVTIWHLMPEMWYAGNRGTDVMYVNTSIYDVFGNEIGSAVLDSAERVVAQAESYFENGVCVRSVQKAGNRTVARISLVSDKDGVLEYNKEMNGSVIRMTVKETSFLRRHKSVVTEDGKVTTISIIKTDRDGYPVKIITTEPQTGNKTIETNKFGDNHTVIEKHVVTINGEDGKKEEEITYTDYGDLDDHGNWKDCRTYNKFRLPTEVLFRDFEYWD